MSFHCVGGPDGSVKFFESFCPTTGRAFQHSVNGQRYDQGRGRRYQRSGTFLHSFQKMDVVSQSGEGGYTIGLGVGLDLSTGGYYSIQQKSANPATPFSLAAATRSLKARCTPMPPIPIRR